MRTFVPVRTLEHEIAGGDPGRLVALHLLLQMLAQSGLLEMASAPAQAMLTLTPIGENFVFALQPVSDDNLYRLSRFGYVRRDEEGFVILETPRGLARLVIHNADAIALLFKLAMAVRIADLDRNGNEPSGRSREELRAVFELLSMACVIEPCSASDTTPEDCNAVFRQWEFHDLLFHSRSRMGRHDYTMGGSFRFKGKIDPRPALKRNTWRSSGIALPRPQDRGAAEPPFFAVLEGRRSVREQGALPITLPQLAEFLFRCARVRDIVTTPIGELSNRPYPNGGASYELELYLTVDRCAGLNSGFYYYDPAEHLLCFITGPNEDTEQMLFDAYQSAAETCRPQVLITLSSRFQRVSWKYSGIAYATQLKNVGALYSVMYLVATAMGLAPCALGLGNSERFCRLSGTPPFEEASIGEFMLGSRFPPAA